MTDHRIEAIVERSSADIVKYPIIKAEIERQGTRTIDTANITFAGGAIVEINDTVSYIQDDVPLNDLVAIWNFQGSYKDESGFHHDGTRVLTNLTNTNPDEGFVIPNFHLGNTKKYRTNYGLKFDAAGQKVIVADKNMASDKTNASLDFRGQFDIIINFKNQANPNLSEFNSSPMILFSKYDTTNSRGVEVGLKVVRSQWVVYAKLDSTEFIGDKTLYDLDVVFGDIDDNDSGATRMIRFYRDEKGVVRLTLDNQADYTSGTASESTKVTQTVEPSIEDDDTDDDFGDYLYNRTADDAYIGAGRSSNTDFNGHIFQIRIYCGRYLENGDVETLMTAGAQQMTQKVSGVVWERTDKLDKINIKVKSRSRSLLETNINSTLIDTNTQTGEATHIRNVFDGGQEASLILKTIVNKIDPDFTFFRNSAVDSNSNFPATDTDGKYMADGAFIKNVDIIMLMAGKGFLTFPTKTFIWEYSAENNSSPKTNHAMYSGYTFGDDEYSIYERGENDIGIINDVEVYGDIQLGHAETNFGKMSDITENQAAPNNSSPILFVAPPLNVQLVEGRLQGIVHTVSITDSGSGYTSTPWCNITGSASTTAAVTVEMEDSPNGDKVKRVNITNHGGGYTTASPPEAVFQSSAGTKAKGICHITSGGGDGAVIPQSVYWIDFNARELYITDNDPLTASPNNYVWAKYDYEIKSDTSISLGGTAERKRHDIREDETAGSGNSITKYGRKSVRWYLPQLLRHGDFSSIAQRIIEEYKDEKRRYTIKAPFLINCIRENLQVTIKSTIMKPKDSNNDGELVLPVKSIKWNYPECTTTIEVGDFNYNLYDILKVTSEAATNMVGSIVKTRS